MSFFLEEKINILIKFSALKSILPCGKNVFTITELSRLFNADPQFIFDCAKSLNLKILEEGKNE